MVQRSAYEEDLSVYRLQLAQSNVPIVPTKIKTDSVALTGGITFEIDSISRLIVAQNKGLNMRDGFTIQVYSGTNRDEALVVQNFFQEQYPELLPNLTYLQPSYRVKLGKFHEKLAATRALNNIKSIFPKSIVIPEKLPIIEPDQ